ncbi:hypothetical protein [Candidatus Proelusimicrobium excrementi]|uniref:hypothetical protein n=1 Tax=Candidatus Proelusimicrobium excrementi TaxID=3416222 RepID=UPI003CBDBEDE|nr:type II secretion system protein [Elusimicrobiaceae bacterium]
MLNKKGYTIVEGIIAMLLVAIMVGGIFTALMASRRAIIEPSYREEMLYAVESLSNQLKNYVDAEGAVASLCGSTTPLENGDHDCSSMLPDVCRTDGGYNSSLTYNVSGLSVTGGTGGFSPTVNQIKINIVCNGEVL